jgi:lipopolysaccharide export system permease protein
LLNYTSQLPFFEEIALEMEWPKGYTLARRPIISVLDRMIATDLLKTLLSVWTVIVVIIVSRKFIRILDKAVDGHISNDTLMTILGLKTVTAGISLLPAAMFMALLMVLGRLYKDQEMSAIAAAGGGAGTLYRAIFIFAFPLSIIACGLTLYASPWAESRVQQLMSQDEQSSDVRGIAAGKFSEYSRGDLVFYVENMNAENKMESVFVQDRKKGNLSIVTSKLSHFEDLPGGRYMVFENGERIQGHPGDYDYVIENFKEYAIKIQDRVVAALLTPNALASSVLWKSKLPREIAELQNRLALPIAILLFAFLSVPLARVSPRGGIYGSMLLGFFVYFSYGNLTSITQSWIIKGAIGFWPGIFGVILLFFIIGLVLLANWYGFQWIMRASKARFSK